MKYTGPISTNVPNVGNEFLQRQLEEQNTFGRSPVQGAVQNVIPKPTAATPSLEVLAPAERSGGYNALDYSNEPTPEDLEYERNLQEFNNQDPFIGQYLGGKPYEDAEAGADAMIQNRMGADVGAERLQQMRNEEIEKQAMINSKILDASQMRNAADLQEAFGENTVEYGGASVVFNLANSLGQNLNSMQVGFNSDTNVDSPSNALSLITAAYNLNNKEAANHAALAVTMITPLVVGSSRSVNAYKKSKGIEVANETATDQFDISDAIEGINALLNTGVTEDSGISDASEQLDWRAMSAEGIETIAGKLFRKFSEAKRQVDPTTGLPLDKSQQIKPGMSDAEVGALIIQSAIDDGKFMRDAIDGKEVVVDNPLTGIPFFLATRDLNAELTGALYGRAQKVPVGQYGDYIGALRNIRPGDIKRRGSKRLSHIDEAKRIAGSIGKIPSSIKGFFGAQLFKTALEQLQNGGAPVNGIDALPFFKISHKALQRANLGAAKGDLNKDAKVIISKINQMAGELFYQAGFMVDGTPIFTAYKEDPSVHRLYQDAIDQNEQRNKWTRAAMTYISTPYRLTNNPYHLTGISTFEAGKLWQSIGDKVWNKEFNLTDDEKELAFLAIMGRALGVADGRSYQVGGRTVEITKTENLTIPDLLTLVTPEFIKEAARIGNALKTIVPGSNKDIVNDLLNLAASVDATHNEGRKRIPGNAAANKPSAFNQLTEEQKMAVQQWLDKSDRETWGYTLQAYLDAASYLDAKINNKPFRPTATIAIDMNSAGRAFMANDVGNFEVLSRVGLLWDDFTDAELQDVMGIKGDPRTYFTSVAYDSAVHTAIGDQEKKMAWITALKKYGHRNAKGSRKFNSSFAKKALLTTDYGKPMMYHLEEARAFLLDDNNSEFLELMLDQYGNDMKKLVEDTNQILYHTLNESSNSWQYSLPKHMTQILQMVNRAPHPEGVFGERIAVGRNGAFNTGEYMYFKGRNGNERKVLIKRTQFDPHAPAKAKLVEDAEGKKTIYQPGPGSAAVNQIGPIMGQYRESVVLSETMNYINGGKAPNQMLNMSPVFDNLILDANSFLQVLYVANNIVVPKVLDWNMPESFVKDFREQMDEAEAELRKQGDSITIGKDSQWKGFLNVIDYHYNFLKDKNINDLREADKLFMKYFGNQSVSGYMPPGDNRPDLMVIKTKQMLDAITIMKNKFGLEDNKRLNRIGLINKWQSGMHGEKEKYMKEIKRLARAGKIMFFT